MTLDTLLADARHACLPLEPTERFDAWLRVWRPAAMALMRKDGLFQGSHLNAWLKIADRLLDVCGIEPDEPEDKTRVRTKKRKRPPSASETKRGKAVERIHAKAESDK